MDKFGQTPTELFLKAEYGMPLSDEEVMAIRGLIEVLQTALPAEQ